ncbi:MAG: HXXEE domain-containing protein [Reyranella sp.]|uniref:HXXEE domain-containing protein n=1 Tax=Reyranella sp. TaxID=1929291 RepID=UPI00120C13CE|nr:HXXEE domain-containing protein [Reyranella sp.]TAJ36792.1 MAG: HXXEE domain-containing protein [Reyranella sp.]
MLSFTYVWPYMGLGAALLLALLLTTDALRSDKSVPRWRDLVWLAWAGTWIYLVHQFEEHGVDAEGAHYAFRGFMCASLGFPDVGTCPVPFSFITSVNVALVWVAGPAAALLGRRWPALALSFFSVPFVNAIAHLAPAIAKGAYNPGVVTSILLFLPLSLWAFHVALGHERLGWTAVIATIAAGFVLHAILMGSVMAYINGWLGVALLDIIQIINPAIAGLIVYLATRRRTA